MKTTEIPMTREEMRSVLDVIDAFNDMASELGAIVTSAEIANHDDADLGVVYREDGDYYFRAAI